MNLHILQQHPPHKLKPTHLMLDDDAEISFVQRPDGRKSLFAFDDVSPTTRILSRTHSESTPRKTVGPINGVGFEQPFEPTSTNSQSATPRDHTKNNHIRTSLFSNPSQGSPVQNPEKDTSVSAQRHLQNRPSLFLTNSNQAAFTVGPGSFDSGAELSDLSEDESDYDSDPDSLDYFETHCVTEKQSAPRRALSTLVLLSEKETAGQYNHRDVQPHHIHHQYHQTNQKHHQSVQPQLQNSRPSKISGASDSSRSSSQALEDGKGKLFFILNSPSPTDKALQENYPGKRQDLLFTSSKDALTTRADLASSVSSFEVSEDEEGLDDEITAEMQNASLAASHVSDGSKNFAGSKLEKSVRSMKSTDTDSEWVSVSSDGDPSEPSPIPPPLSFSKRIPSLNSPKSKIGAIRGSRFAEENVEFTAPRSLLSGLFLNEMANLSVANTLKSGKESNEPSTSPSLNGNEDQQVLHQKPVLKRSSTTGIITVDRRADKKSLQRPSIILSKRYGSLSDISRNLSTYRLPVLYVGEEDVIKEGDSGGGAAVGDNQFTKQLSSVGLSDFMVVANSSLDSSVLQSHVDTGQEVYRIAHQQPSRSESRLSSSLSKFSTVHLTTGASLKSLLSKSSLNLSSLFGQPKGAAKPRLAPRSASTETVKSASTLKSPSKLEHSNSSQTGLISEVQGTSPKEQTTNNKEQALSRSIRISAFPKKDFQPSVSISNSLKDSLMIDHKLGKNPLPDKVISEEDLFHGQNLNSLIQEVDDYHSKGW